MPTSPSGKELVLHLIMALALPAPPNHHDLTQTGDYQSHDTALEAPPEFEVATIKPNKVGGPEIIKPLQNGIRASNVTLLQLIKSAYVPLRLDDDRIENLPDWASRDRFDVEAKTSDTQTEQIRHLSLDERGQLLNTMLQGLLADRFQLKAHTGNKVTRVFQLSKTKAGFKLKGESSADPQFPNGTVRIRPGHMDVAGITMDRLAATISQQLKTPVKNNTGLPGRYSFELRLPQNDDPDTSQESTFTAQSLSSAADDLSLSIDEAMEKQIGLQLRLHRDEAVTLIVDKVSKPSGN